jgi:hypothetical protein
MFLITTYMQMFNMNAIMFTFQYHFLGTIVVGLHMGSLVWLSTVVIALVLSHYF